jgi:hypothetical protein
MPAKKRPSMRKNQQRKMMMQKIAKGGPQMSGVKKPAPAKAAPSGRQPRAITNGGSATMKQIRAKAVKARLQGQGKPVMGGAKGKATVLPNSARAGKNLIKAGAQQMRTIGDSGQVRAAQAQGNKAKATAQRNRARRAAGVGKGLKEAQGAAKTLGTIRSLMSPVGAAAAVSAPRPTADGTLTAAMKRGDYKPRQGPAVPKRLTQGGMDKGSFDKAFKAARVAGKKIFTWRGKKYTTKMK